MLSLNGIYQNGKLELDQEVSAWGPVKVIVTFLEEEKLQKVEEENLSEKEEMPDPYFTLIDFSTIGGQGAYRSFKSNF